MRKVTICMLLLIFSTTSFCQETTPEAPMTRADYLKKSKSQKIIGFVLIGVGAITLAAISGGNTDLGAIGPIAGIGVACILISIPVFIGSAKNKKRAANATVSLHFEKTRLVQQTQIVSATIPGVSLKLNLK